MAKEKVGYPPSYKGGESVKSIREQIGTINECFGTKLAFNGKENVIKVPEGAEGNFVIPDWQLLGKTFNEAMMRLLDVLNSSRTNGIDFFDCFIEDPEWFRHSPMVLDRIEKLRRSREEFVIVPAQFGARWFRTDIRMARNEFPLGAYEVGCMLLTHPERLIYPGFLGVKCAPGEIANGSTGGFDYQPDELHYQVFNDLEPMSQTLVLEGSTDLFCVGEGDGLATGFLPGKISRIWRGFLNR